MHEATGTTEAEAFRPTAVAWTVGHEMQGNRAKDVHSLTREQTLDLKIQLCLNVAAGALRLLVS